MVLIFSSHRSLLVRLLQYPPRERAQISKLDHRISGRHNQQGKITSNEQTCEAETLYSDKFSGSMTFHFLVTKISAILATDAIAFGPLHMADTVVRESRMIPVCLDSL